MISFCGLVLSSRCGSVDCDFSIQYNRMTEQQQRLRDAALASMKARGEALGDIAMKDKVAAKRRAEEEDARLVRLDDLSCSLGGCSRVF